MSHAGGRLTVAHPRAGERRVPRDAPAVARAEPSRSAARGRARERRLSCRVALYRLDDPGPAERSPSLIVALDGWVDAGSAATTAAGLDRRRRSRRRDLRRRPALRLPGPPADPRDRRRPAVRARLAGVPDPPRPGRRPRLLVLDRPRAGLPLAEPGRGGQRGRGALGVTEWISLGAIPAAVPHTRPVPILGTASTPGPPPRRHPARPGRACSASRRLWSASSRCGRPRTASTRSATSPRSPTTSAARTRRPRWSCSTPSSGISASS